MPTPQPDPSRPESTPDSKPESKLDSKPESKLDSKRRYHSQHRLRSHEQAHAGADAEAQEPPAILSHPQVPANMPAFISQQRGLDELIDQLRSAGQFAYDTEFIGEHTYHPRLCVIQVATAREVALVDPLADVDLTPFWELVADAGIEKIVHAGLHDLQPVQRHLNRPPRNVFDVQIAAAFIGLRYPMAAGTLVREMTSADVGRGSKFSQWDHRPLSPVQLQYAANDVRYLPLVRQIIGGQLQEKGIADWVAEECLVYSDPALYRFDSNVPRLRVRGAQGLDPPRRRVLRGLLAWREEAAQAEDVPPRSLLRDEIVLALALGPVDSVQELGAVRGLPRPVKQRYAQQIITVMRTALSDAAAALPVDDEPEDELEYDRHAHKARINELWQVIEQKARQRTIEPAIVAAKKDIARLVRAQAAGKPINPADHRVLRGWRRELLGPLE